MSRCTRKSIVHYTKERRRINFKTETMTKEQINQFIELANGIVAIAEQQEVKCDTFTNWITASGSQWCSIWKSSHKWSDRKPFTIKMTSPRNQFHFVEVNLFSNTITFDFTMSNEELQEMINDIDVRVDFELNKKENIEYQIVRLQKQIELLKEQLQ